MAPTRINGQRNWPTQAVSSAEVSEMGCAMTKEASADEVWNVGEQFFHVGGHELY